MMAISLGGVLLLPVLATVAGPAAVFSAFLLVPAPLPPALPPFGPQWIMAGP